MGAEIARHQLPPDCGFRGARNAPGRLWICYIMPFNGKDSPERLAYDPIWFDADGWIQSNAPTLGTQVVP